jgi:hypothetical protein
MVRESEQVTRKKVDLYIRKELFHASASELGRLYATTICRLITDDIAVRQRYRHSRPPYLEAPSQAPTWLALHDSRKISTSPDFHKVLENELISALAGFYTGEPQHVQARTREMFNHLAPLEPVVRDLKLKTERLEQEVGELRSTIDRLEASLLNCSTPGRSRSRSLSRKS